MTIESIKYHVYPIKDVAEHILEGTTCWCNPKEDEEGVITHNSFDGREEAEVATKQ